MEKSRFSTTLSSPETWAALPGLLACQVLALMRLRRSAVPWHGPALDVPTAWPEKQTG